jgi:hypothetical protein
MSRGDQGRTGCENNGNRINRYRKRKGRRFFGDAPHCLLNTGTMCWSHSIVQRFPSLIAAAELFLSVVVLARALAMRWLIASCRPGYCRYWLGPSASALQFQ